MKNMPFRTYVCTLLITTAPFYSAAMAAEYVVNTPTVVTNGDAGNVMNGNDTLTVTETGSISTVLDNTNAINTINNNNIINNAGTLSTTGMFSAGISALGNFNSVNNTGTITTTGGTAPGIEVMDFSTVVNSGRIFTTGAGSAGITANEGNVIDNSGYVVSLLSNSFFFRASDNTLNLTAPSFVGGAFDLGTDTTLNITTGASQSVLWTFTPGQLVGGAPNVGGDVPSAWDAATGQFAVVDPTALSAATDVLADNTQSLSEMTRMNGAADYDELWLKWFGNVAGYGAQEIFNDYTTLNVGFAVGGSLVLSENFSAGAMLGYQASQLIVDSAWMTSQTILDNGIVGAVSANMTLDEFFADFTVFGGARSNTSSRLVNDNLIENSLGETWGIDYANANYNSWFIAPELRVGIDIATDGPWTITPSATARYSIEQVSAYTETGSNANVTYSAGNVQVFEGNLELAASRGLDSGDATIRGGMQYRQNVGGTTTDITLLGQNLAMPLDNSGMLIGYVGADVSFDVGEMGTLDVSGKMAVGSTNFISVSGSVGFKSQF